MGGFGAPGDTNPPPAREVVIPTLYVQADEVTNAEFRRFLADIQAAEPTAWRKAFDALVTPVNAGGYGLSADEADRHPAVGVTHGLAESFAAWAGGRLPTSPEWEFFARSGGEPIPFVWGRVPTLELNTDRANIDSRDRPDAPTSPVGYYPADRTEQGVRDLTGNVREWTSTSSPGLSTSAGSPPYFVVRGGSWHSDVYQFATTHVENLPTDEAPSDVGFRVVLEVGSETPGPTETTSGASEVAD